jgi:phosphoenolpyruvate carboxykinase (ATP)
MIDRVNFVKSTETDKGGFNKLPAEALEALQKIVSELK